MKKDPLELLVPMWVILLSFVVIMVLSAVGNIAVSIAFSRSKSLKGATSMFMMSQAVSNLLVGVLVTALALTQFVRKGVFVGALCQVPLFLELASVTVSIYSLMAVSIDRYVAVIHPTCRSFSTKVAAAILVAVWLGGLLYGSRFFIQFSVSQDKSDTLISPATASGAARTLQQHYVSFVDAPLSLGRRARRLLSESPNLKQDFISSSPSSAHDVILDIVPAGATSRLGRTPVNLSLKLKEALTKLTSKVGRVPSPFPANARPTHHPLLVNAHTHRTHTGRTHTDRTQRHRTHTAISPHMDTAFSVRKLLTSGTKIDDGDDADDDGGHNDDENVNEDDEDGNDDDDNDSVCNLFVEEDENDLPYRTADLVVLFFVPFLGMSYMYTRIARRLWGRDLAVTESVRRKRKVVKLLVVNIVIFFFSWIPFYLVDFVSDSLKLSSGDGGEEEIESDATYIVFRFVFILLALSSSFVTPFVYLTFYDSLRQQVWRCLVFLPFVRHNRVVPSADRPAIKPTVASVSRTTGSELVSVPVAGPSSEPIASASSSSPAVTPSGITPPDTSLAAVVAKDDGGRGPCETWKAGPPCPDCHSSSST